jgi:hypothetical protein
VVSATTKRTFCRSLEHEINYDSMSSVIGGRLRHELHHGVAIHLNKSLCVLGSQILETESDDEQVSLLQDQHEI